MSEARLQTEIVKYISYAYPKIRYCASLGGIFTTPSQARKAVATGYRKGYPDLFLCYPTNKYAGLFLEIKFKGYATKEQKEWITYLNKVGFKAEVCKGFDKAREVIDNYLSNGKYKAGKDK
jgi:hypothetical protein